MSEITSKPNNNTGSQRVLGALWAVTQRLRAARWDEGWGAILCKGLG
jgi:hypothetical protein